MAAARPARRAAATSRRNVVQSSSDEEADLLEDSQPTPRASRNTRRSTTGSRTSFDQDYTPMKGKPVVTSTPLSIKSRTSMTPQARAPLVESKKSRQQSQTPRSTGKKGSKVHMIKEGYEDLIVHESQKENITPSAALEATKYHDVPLKPILLSQTRPLSPSIDVMPEQSNLAIQAIIPESTGPKTRIVISRLVLENFKSYAGIQQIGPFHKSFSAVVGPNGSGKSNVIDSLLFVFGFRASKMRQGKISALIHNSAAYPDLDHCSVEVHFQTIYDTDDPSDYKVVENSTIIVARQAFKNNSSKYTINKRDSSFTEVTTMLREAGIDLDHKRFLILQGEVESIAQMRPKAANEHDDGLLEYLEDIIGTSKYKAPIEGAIERMDALSTICQEKASRVQIVEKERARLEEQKDLAVQQITSENELVIKESALYQLHAHHCSTRISMAAKVVDELEEELQQIGPRFKVKDIISQLEKKHKLAVKNHEELKVLLAKYSSEASKTEKAMVQLQEKEKHLMAKKKKLSKSSEAASYSRKECSHQLQGLDDELCKHASDMQALSLAHSKEERELGHIRHALKDKTQHFVDQIEAKQKKKQPWDTQIAEKRSALAIATSELEMLNEKSSQTERDLEQAAQQLQDFEISGQEKASTIKDVEGELTRAQHDLVANSEQLNNLRKVLKSSQAIYNESRQKADEARSNLSATQSQGDVISGLTRLRDSGRISGFHGRLGDLGKIDDKYDVAISTACPALNNIVVDSVDVGQACIDHLRKNNLGRAMFILLDRLPRKDLSPIATPEDAPRLYDLVQLKEERFGAAFYSVLQNTLVANDLAQANRIAYGKTRWRVVTIDGQLIDKSGTMSGGGSKVSKGGMSSKFASAETTASVAKLENVSKAKEIELSGLQKQISDLESTVADLETRIPELETQKSRLTLDLQAMARQRSDLKKRAKELQALLDDGLVESTSVQEVQRSITDHKNEIARLLEESAGLEDDIKALQERILDVGGIKLRSQKSKVDGLSDQLEALSQRVDTASLAKTRLGKELAKHEKIIELSCKELEDTEHDLVGLQEQIASVNGGQASSKEVDDTQFALDESSTSLQQLKVQLEEERASINATKAKELDLRNRIDEHKKRHSEDSKKLAHYTDKLARLTLQVLSEHFLASQPSGPQQMTTYTEDELDELDMDQIKADITQLEHETQNTKIDLSVLDEYLRRCEEHTERAKALSESVQERDLARSTAEDLRRRRLTEFMTGFNIISMRLKEMYQMITMGGNAELELVDSLDPFSEGILFSVMPPKKSWKNISNLSGGEKTLSSLALVFALHHYKPTPLYVMDEIDAALDFRNVSIVANYIKDRTKNAQFIVISLRNNMFELAARLVGIYKTNNATKSIAIENRELVAAR